jgi:hypothetical protein
LHTFKNILKLPTVNISLVFKLLSKPSQTYAHLENIIIFINCKWVDTRWQWLFYVYTECPNISITTKLALHLVTARYRVQTKSSTCGIYGNGSGSPPPRIIIVSSLSINNPNIPHPPPKLHIRIHLSVVQKTCNGAQCISNRNSHFSPFQNH